MHPLARSNPLSAHALRTRGDLQQAVRDLVAPLLPHFSAGGARVRLGAWAAHFPQADAELEGFARPLFGLAPLAAGGGHFEHWDRWQQGIASGVDPEHPEHWSRYEGTAQTMVEQAALGFALALVPELLFDPLPGRAQQQLLDWLKRIERHEPVANNWHFFRVLVQAGLDRVGAPVDREARERSLAFLDGLALGEAWYEDGKGGARDHYVGWALHAYGLLFARLAPDHALAPVFRTRARRFAGDFALWFDPEGRVVPFGRSLTYRFAAAGFWSALAFADEEALPWGAVKGLLLRHLRSWAGLPVCDRDGILSVGYAYPNPWMREGYNSAGSPYWAMKAFLCLALPEEHPFWAAPEEPAAPEARDQPEPGMRLARDPHQSVALSGGHGSHPAFEQGAAKYGRLAYSSRFGPCLALEAWGRSFPGDSVLCLREPQAAPRIARRVEEHAVVEGCVYSRWSPAPGVTVHSVLFGGAPWHGRLHRVVSDRALEAEESGFAAGDWEALRTGLTSGAGSARVSTPEGVSVLVDLPGSGPEGVARQARCQPLPPNASLTRPYCAVPVLRASLPAGRRSDLACAVFGGPPGAEPGEAPGVDPRARALLDARCPPVQ